MSSAPSLFVQTELVSLAKELKVQLFCLRGLATFSFRHYCADNKRLAGRFSKDDCSSVLGGTPIANLQIALNKLADHMFGNRTDDEIADFDPSDDPRIRAIDEDIAADGSEIRSEQQAAAVLIQMAESFCKLLQACVAFANQQSTHVDNMQKHAHYAWLKVRTSFETFGLPEIADRMAREPDWFDTFRHYVYGFSLQSEGVVVDQHTLVKIGYTGSKMEYYSAYRRENGDGDFPCSLKDYDKRMKNERSMLVDDKTSRILTVAQRFSDWDEDDGKYRDNRALFIFGPFPTKSAAVHAEHLVRMLAGKAVHPAQIEALMNGVNKDGAGDFVAVPDAMLKKLEDLNLECGRCFTADSRQVVDDLAHLLKLK